MKWACAVSCPHTSCSHTSCARLAHLQEQNSAKDAMCGDGRQRQQQTRVGQGAAHFISAMESSSSSTVSFRSPSSSSAISCRARASCRPQCFRMETTKFEDSALSHYFSSACPAALAPACAAPAPRAIRRPDVKGRVMRSRIYTLRQHQQRRRSSRHC